MIRAFPVPYSRRPSAMSGSRARLSAGWLTAKVTRIWFSISFLSLCMVASCQSAPATSGALEQVPPQPIPMSSKAVSTPPSKLGVEIRSSWSSNGLVDVYVSLARVRAHIQTRLASSVLRGSAGRSITFAVASGYLEIRNVCMREGNMSQAATAALNGIRALGPIDTSWSEFDPATIIFALGQSCGATTSTEICAKPGQHNAIPKRRLGTVLKHRIASLMTDPYNIEKPVRISISGNCGSEGEQQTNEDR